MQNLNFETIKQFFIIKWKLLSVLGIVVFGSVIVLLNVDKSSLSSLIFNVGYQNKLVLRNSGSGSQSGQLYTSYSCLMAQLLGVGSGVSPARQDDVYKNLGLTIPVGNAISRYKIQRFRGDRSDRYTVGSGDIDRKDNCNDQYYLSGRSYDPSRPASCSRRVRSYFGDHDHIIECNVPSNNTGTSYGYGYGYMPSYGYGYGYGYKTMRVSEKPYLYLLKPIVKVSKVIYDKFKDLVIVKKLPKGFNINKMINPKDNVIIESKKK